MAKSYADYLKLERLLALQGGLGEDEKALAADELLFVIVHQIDELWFKLVLRELETARDLFKRDYVPETALASAARGLHRVARAFELAAAHFALMETMTPRDFLDFRDKLAPASGFQSPQFREVEILLGLPSDARLPFGNESSFLAAVAPRAGDSAWASKRVRARLEDRPTLKQAIDQWLARTPIDGSRPGDAGDEAAVRRFLESFLACHERETLAAMEQAAASAPTPADAKRLEERYRVEIAEARAFLLPDDARVRRARAATLFIESYRELPLLAWPREILDLVIEMEQSLLVFRQRHARMVERMIGRRVGTGGSTGVDYLDETALRYRIFGDLWAVRTLLLRQVAVPPLAHASFYGFKS